MFRFPILERTALVPSSLACALALAACGEGSIEATQPLHGISGTAGSGGASASTGGSTAGSGGASVATGGSSVVAGSSSGGSGGSTTGGGSSVGTGGSSVGTGGSSGGMGGASAGSGGSSLGPAGAAGAGGSAGGTGGSGTSTGAWRPFDDTSPWNTPIGPNPAIDPNSSTLVADLAASAPASTPNLYINIQQYSIPVFWADASTPKRNVTVTVVAGQGFGNGGQGSALVPIPPGAAPAAGTDKHLCIIDKQTHTEWGMWDASSSGNGFTASVAATADLSGSGVRPPKANNPTWWTSPGARACGFPLSAGLITVEEMKKGKIEHALIVAYPHMRSHWYRPPASTAQGTTGLALPTRGVPCGGQIQLDPSLDVNALPLSASGKIIARALQEYGAYVGDFSGAITLYADASPDALAAWNAGLLKNDELGAIDLKRLRVLSIGTMFEDDN